eukprot:1195709-Prorocentrum_minimum.AAC.5
MRSPNPPHPPSGGGDSPRLSAGGGLGGSSWGLPSTRDGNVGCGGVRTWQQREGSVLGGAVGRGSGAKPLIWERPRKSPHR